MAGTTVHTDVKYIYRYVPIVCGDIVLFAQNLELAHKVHITRVIYYCTGFFVQKILYRIQRLAVLLFFRERYSVHKQKIGALYRCCEAATLKFRFCLFLSF